MLAAQWVLIAASLLLTHAVFFVYSGRASPALGVAVEDSFED